jgi:hypothetical protein
MGEQPYSGDSPEERSVNWLQPILFRAVFHQVFECLVPPLNQLSATADIKILARIDLAHRRIPDISGYTEKLAEQVDRFADVTIDEAD